MSKLVDINIQMINCDTCIKESVVPNSDGSYTIFLNARQTREQQIISYNHALKHILGDDFTKDDVDKIEFNAHSA